MKCGFVLGVLCVALQMFPRNVVAQSTGDLGAIAGKVVLKADTAIHLVGALVRIIGLDIDQETDSAGRFRFSPIRQGRYELLVRRLGYGPVTRMVTVAAGITSAVTVEMDSKAQELREVMIGGRRTLISARFAEAYRRASLGFGDYITREEVSHRNPFDTKSLLNGLPGVSVSDRGVVFRRCLGPGAKVQVYVDGLRLTRTMDVNSALLSVHPSDIEIMEVYRGVSRIPGEFLEDACAVIAIWTKSY